MKKNVVSAFYGLTGVHLLFESISLARRTPDGNAVGVHPFGIEILVENSSINNMSNFLLGRKKS